MPSRFLICALAIGPVLATTSAFAQAGGCAEPPSSPLVVNVKDKGAKGDGETDDSDAIRDAVGAVAGTGGTVFVPDGVYMIDAVNKAIKLKSGMTLKLAPGAKLKAFPNKERNYSIIDIASVADVTVTGGTLEGERRDHQGKDGEGGMGIRILRDAKRITVSGVTAQEMWGDGFYVKGAEDVKFCAVTAIHNRRQGMSIVEANGVLVTHSSFRDTRGTPPAAGIDLEPDRREQRIKNVRIVDSEFVNNEGEGIKLHGKKGAISKLEIRRNVFRNNKPIALKGDYAALASNICNNRYISEERVAGRADGLYAYGEPVKMMHQGEGWVITLNRAGGCGGS
jgi:hypothetical protein